MDFKFTEEEQSVRREMFEVCRELAKKHPPPWYGTEEDPFISDEGWEYHRYCAKEFAKRGWLSIDWPTEYGGQGRSRLYKAFLEEARGYHRVPGRDMFGVNMLPPTLLEFGTEEQKRKFLPPIASADVFWCQYWSEPNAGSDLANVSTTAVRKGDVYVLNGQKTWSSSCHRADWAFGLFRTDPNAEPKHRGLSFFLVDTKSPGITASPIYRMNGKHSFNDIFFDNVEVPAENLLGEENRGWYVTRALMNAERSQLGQIMLVRRNLEELVEFCHSNTRRGKPLSEDPLIRNRLAQIACELEACLALAYRLAWAQDKGVAGAPEASALKVFGDELTIHTAYLGSEIMGAYGQVKYSKWAPLEAFYEDFYQDAFALSIAAGTDEIQRNIIAWEGLGLPRMR